jgi:lipoprotein-anchoring transpeptidase ErfK/SrfK
VRARIVQLTACVAALTIFTAAAPQRPRGTSGAKRAAPRKTATAVKKSPDPPPLECGDYLSFQVLLDRQGFSTGEIDGKPGTNLSRAIAALQAVRHMPITGRPDCDTWHALGGDRAEPATMTYTVSDDDIRGPFTPNIPRDLAAQASLEALGYRSPLEMLAERFHASAALLQDLNDRMPIAAGSLISVPAVTPFLFDEKPEFGQVDDAVVQVTRDDSALRATHADGTVLLYAPVTTGSVHDPLPIGDWKVVGVRWHPVFHYNPNLFWDAKPGDTRADIKAGPNNPVGVVWISLSKEHYGLHGTPEPGHIGHTESHGCVRLTNWDAARVAAIVKPGTPVQFR